MTTKRIRISGTRKAQIVAESVSVLCPFCSEPQPDWTGSEMWTPESFIHSKATRKCVSCDQSFIVSHERKVIFDLPKAVL